MGNGDFGSILDTFANYTAQGDAPYVIHISGDVHAIAYSGTGIDGFISTFTMDSDGVIGDTLIDTLEFETTFCNGPCILHISGDYYAIACRGAGFDGWLFTVTITPAGVIGNAVVDSLEFDGLNCAHPIIIKVSGDIYAISYLGNNSDGFVVTVDISTVGVITDPVVDSWEFDTVKGYHPVIIKVSGTTYAIAYSNNDIDGEVFSFTIANDGTITKSKIDSLTFSTDSQDVSFIHVSGDFFAIASQGTTNLSVFTVEISAAGVIPATVTDSLVIDTAAVLFLTPDIIHVKGNVYVVGYTGADNDGYIASMTISTSGIISSSVVSSFEYDTGNSYSPSIVAFYSSILLIGYQAGVVGNIRSVGITVPVVFPSDALLRASGIVRTFFAGIGGQAVYQATLTLGGFSTTFVLPIGSRQPSGAVPSSVMSLEDYKALRERALKGELSGSELEAYKKARTDALAGIYGTTPASISAAEATPDLNQFQRDILSSEATPPKPAPKPAPTPPDGLDYFNLL
ncbi:hypothetical protein LCGC14_0477290 [marine sediment metagenome]|uniref:Uncharacterized protein n=1 Tax=marine sediment metagenome TaxID=412755 RepID=A0A0F9STG3_9ZZZZ